MHHIILPEMLQSHGQLHHNLPDIILTGEIPQLPEIPIGRQLSQQVLIFAFGHFAQEADNIPVSGN